MKTLIAGVSLLAVMLLNSPGLHAQDKTDTTKLMLHPDDSTQYSDEFGHKINAMQFATSIQTGKFSFVPEVVNGKVKNLRLKEEEKTLSAGGTAPDFSVTDIKGNRYSLKQMRGKIVILNFWFPGCLPCVREIPELNTLYDKYKQDTDIVFLAITYDPARVVKDFISKKVFRFSVVADEQNTIANYGITSFPTSMVIDREGSISFIVSAYDPNNVQKLDGVISALK